MCWCVCWLHMLYEVPSSFVFVRIDGTSSIVLAAVVSFYKNRAFSSFLVRSLSESEQQDRVVMRPKRKRVGGKGWSEFCSPAQFWNLVGITLLTQTLPCQSEWRPVYFYCVCSNRGTSPKIFTVDQWTQRKRIRGSNRARMAKVQSA